jgi:hypothetical protein
MNRNLVGSIFGRSQVLERTFHRCFLPSFTSFGWGVSEEKIKMWKFNGRQTMDAKWWQKLTLPLARWAKKDKIIDYKILILCWTCPCNEIWLSVSNTSFFFFLFFLTKREVDMFLLLYHPLMQIFFFIVQVAYISCYNLLQYCRWFLRWMRYFAVYLNIRVFFF